MEFYVMRENSLSHKEDDSLQHYGVLGMKWGVRRYQNYDGTRTAAGKKRYWTGAGLADNGGESTGRAKKTKTEQRLDKDLKTITRRFKKNKRFGSYIKSDKDLERELSFRLRKPIEDYVDLEGLRFRDKPEYLKLLERNMRDVREGMLAIARDETEEVIKSDKFKRDLLSALKTEIKGPCDDAAEFNRVQYKQTINMLESLKYTPMTKSVRDALIKREENYKVERDRVVDEIVDRVRDRPVTSFKEYTASAKNVIRNYIEGESTPSDRYSTLEYVFTESIDYDNDLPYTMKQYNALSKKS